MAPTQSLKFLIDANSDQAIAQIKRAVDAVFGLGNATLTVNKDATEAYRQVQASANALANTTAAAADRVRAAYDAQRAALDPLYASSQRYASVVQTVNAALDAQVINQTEANRVLAMAEQRYLGVDKAAAVAGAQTVQMAGHSRNLGFQVQNAAYQIGDFAVQVAGGTSAMRAAGQQLPQLLGGFGVWGAVIGGAVAVLAALVPLIMTTGQESEKAKAAIKAYGESFGLIKTDLAEAAALEGEYTAALQSGSQQRINAIQAEAAVRAKLLELDLIDQTEKEAAAARELAEAKKAVGAAIQQWADFQLIYNQAVATGQDQTEQDAAAKNVREATEEIDKQQAAYHRLSLEHDLIKTQIDANNDRLKTTQGLLSKIAGGAEGVSKSFDGAAAQAQVLAENVVNVMAAAAGLSRVAPDAGWLGGAISDAKSLASWLWNAAAGAAAARATASAPDGQSVIKGGVRPEVVQGIGPDQASRDAVAEARIRIAQNLATGSGSNSSGSGGGGGGGSSPVEDLKKEGTDALQAMEDAIAGVNEKVSLGLISTAEGTKAIADAKDKASNALADLIPKLERMGGPAAKSFIENWRSSIAEMQTGLSEAGQKISDSLSSNFEDAFASFVTGASKGRSAFDSFTSGVLNNMAKMASQRFTAQFVSPLFDSLLGSLGFANGGVPSLGDGGSPTFFAKGGVPSIERFAPPLPAFRNSIAERPTFFAMGGGRMGVMGEAGSEAIMPLARGKNGKLGVVAQGAGGGHVINIHNYGAQVTATERKDNGVSVTDIVVRQIKGAIVDDINRGGDVSDALSRTFGATRRGV